MVYLPGAGDDPGCREKAECCGHMYWRRVQNALKNMEEECTHLQMMYQSSQEELEQLVERSDEHVLEIRELNDKFQVHSLLGVDQQARNILLLVR